MNLTVSRVLHAGYIFEFGQTKIIFDPLFENPFSRNCFAFPPIEFNLEELKETRFSGVFISHFHDDHCSLESLDLIDRHTPIYIFCLFDEVVTLIKELGFVRVIPLLINKSVYVGPFCLTPRRALDATVDCLFQIQVGGINILNVVDSWIDDSTFDLLLGQAPWDLVLWPFQTMRELEVLAPARSLPSTRRLPEEWITQLKLLNPQYLIPSSCQFKFESWSWYNRVFFPISYRIFQAQIADILPETRVIRMNPGAVLAFSDLNIDSNLKREFKVSSRKPLPWILPRGPQDVDYEYIETEVPPATSDLAKYFEPATEAQWKRINSFCTVDLLQKYRELEPLEEGFFSRPRFWNLIIFDRTSKKRSYFYQIHGSSMTLMDSVPPGKLPWTTEMIAVRFWSALEEGESLSSLYLRITDNCKSYCGDREFSLADLEEDPLIRCLFNGHVGGYQRAQLQRIQKSGHLFNPMTFRSLPDKSKGL